MVDGVDAASQFDYTRPTIPLNRHLGSLRRTDYVAYLSPGQMVGLA